MSGAHQVSWWGAFDPYTFGVWCSSDKVHDLPDPEEVDHLFTLSLVAPPGDQHRAYLAGLDLPADRILGYTIFSVYAHEWRHWYDATSTPFGMVRTTQLAAFFATLANLDELLADRDEIFVPLLRWISAPELIRIVHPDLPELDPDIVELVERARVVLRKADFALNARAPVNGIPISTVQILEGLAMLRQETAVAEAFGVPAAEALRESMRAGPGKRAYYAAVDLVEAKAGPDREIVTTILEAALFGDYGRHGSMFDLTPPLILNSVLNRINTGPGADLDAEIDRALTLLQYTDRRVAHANAYGAATRTLGQIAAAGAADLPDSEAALIRGTLGSALSDAFLWGGSARFRDDYIAQNPSLPYAEPYSFTAPLVVEGYPGLTGPVSELGHVVTLAGIDYPSYDAYRHATEALGWASVAGPDEPYRTAVLWTPNPGGEELPAYYDILNILRPLLYRRGIIFGAGAMSPITFHFTAYGDAAERGQTLIGPGVPPAPLSAADGS